MMSSVPTLPSPLEGVVPYDNTTPLLASEGTTTVVNPNIHMRDSVPPEQARRINYKDLKRIIEKHDDVREVTIEQIKRVKMMHDKFMFGAVSDFNYNTLLFVASVLAALGLASNSSATIIASMLVSPLMGPVVGLAYGTTIFDRKMIQVAAINELLSLLFCIVMGVIIGAITGMTGLADNWPTPEMLGRTTLQNFYVGIPIAFFSGLGVAVSLLDEQVNSLVGVAISASLLPPAVNCGIVWIAYAYYQTGKFELEEDKSWKQFSRAGWTSLGLTLINIVMIWISSMLMFRLKEVLPIKKKVFWDDLSIARKIYQGKAYLFEQLPPAPPVDTSLPPPDDSTPAPMDSVSENHGAEQMA